MNSKELHELADKLVDPSDTLFKFHMDQAAAYLRACADALDAGFVRGAVLDYDGVSLIRPGTEHRRCIERGSRLLYPLAVPAQAQALRLPEPMTEDELLDTYAHTPGSIACALRAIEAETMRRVKEANK